MINFLNLLNEKNVECHLLYYEDKNFKLNLKPFYNSRLIKFSMNFFNHELFKKFKIYSFLKLLILTIKIRNNNKNYNYDKLIAIDSLSFLASYMVSDRSVYYSLEIDSSLFTRLISKYINIRLLISQSEERAEFLNFNYKKLILLPNSIIVKNNLLKQVKKRFDYKFCYCGTISLDQGFNSYLKILELNKKYQLLLKGTVANQQLLKDLIANDKKIKSLYKEKRLMFNFEYLDDYSLKTLLEEQSIGLCLFEDYALKKYGYNYISSPSGKIYYYYMSGLPIIANDIIGNKHILDDNSGVLINEINEINIKFAIDSIIKNYEYFSINSYSSFKKYDYRKFFINGYKQIIN